MCAESEKRATAHCAQESFLIKTFDSLGCVSFRRFVRSKWSNRIFFLNVFFAIRIRSTIYLIESFSDHGNARV